MLLGEAISVHVASVRALASRGSRGRPAEAALLAVHLAGYLAVVFLVLSPVKAVVFIGVQQGLFGLYLGASFAPNHKGMPILDAADRSDFLRRQVLTSRNVRGGWLTDLVMGGLNYQIEHHLFPSMPRPNLRRSQALIEGILPAARPVLLRDQPGRLLRPGAAPPRRRRPGVAPLAIPGGDRAGPYSSFCGSRSGPVYIDRSPPVAVTGAKRRGRGVPALPLGRQRGEFADISGAGPGAREPIRGLHGRHQRLLRRLCLVRLCLVRLCPVVRSALPRPEPDASRCKECKEFLT